METNADHGARDTGAPDLDNFPRFPLDMNAIARAAVAPKLRRWRLEFDCNGRPFNWEGDAETVQQADSVARGELADAFPHFLPADARAVVCVEV